MAECLHGGPVPKPGCVCPSCVEARGGNKRPAPRGDAAIVCPHCGVKGKVRTKHDKAKVGVSGGKATGAVLTLGFSILGTGLSRKQRITRARCGNCHAEWQWNS